MFMTFSMWGKLGTAENIKISQVLSGVEVGIWPKSLLF